MKIKIEHEGQQYTLEYTRRSVCVMDSKGFDPESYEKDKVSFVVGLFDGAFIAHHKDISQETIDAIYDSLADKEHLLEALGKMYAEAVTSLVEAGNVKWETEA